MAYFDSPKNRALWEIELKKLREEKEFRSQNKGLDLAHLKEDRLQKQMDAVRKKTSYKELVMEEEAARGIRHTEDSRAKQMSMAPVLDEPVKKGPVR